MRSRLRKLTGALCAIGMMLCSAGTSLSLTASATLPYGDVNDDGSVTTTDSLDLLKYSKGMYRGDAINLKNADVDKNLIIDVNDQKILNKSLIGAIGPLPYSQSGYMVDSNTYTIPTDEARSYKKYNCSSGSTTDYTLSLPAALSSIPDSLRSGSVDDRVLDSSDNAQCIVKLNFKESDGDTYRGTGFIVGDGVIATCAHCLYDGTAFNTNYQIKVYDAAGTSVVATYSAKELHIPTQYYNNKSTNYDYGLIYVDADLSDYGTMALGVPTTEFATVDPSPYPRPNLYVSGFPTYVWSSVNPVSNRYFGSGVISSMNNYKMWYTPYTSGGDSGGPVFLEYTLGTETYRSAIGIHTEGNTFTHLGIRITSPLLRFYYNNSHIG